ncbi:DUF2000 domain-containing protein [Paraburkholderia sp. BCC1885]|uniref:DUF2000 domain-containing protein n=1 Tax=Paraburkholderia sp. BCC1885 TaxID=2562669 RepID=UPI001182AFA7|nr:DUF2000 domain-containing protein [Paraburkholderia sp. BCC1885]
MEFDTKVALVVRDDLASWQKLNVTAFLATGIAASAPEAIGIPYEDANGRQYAALLRQPVMVYGGDSAGLLRAFQQGQQRELTIAVYVKAMFSTGNDEDNRAAFLAEPADQPDLVGIALRGPKKMVDKALKGLSLHP